MTIKLHFRFKHLLIGRRYFGQLPFACGKPSLCGWPTKRVLGQDECGVPSEIWDQSENGCGTPSNPGSIDCGTPSVWPPDCGASTCGTPSVPGCGTSTCGTPSDPGCGAATCGTPSAWPPDCGSTTCGTPSEWPPECGTQSCGTPSEDGCGEVTCGTPSDPGCGETTCGTPSAWPPEDEMEGGWLPMSGAQVMFSTSEFSDLMFDLNVKQVAKSMLEGIESRADLEERMKAVQILERELKGMSDKFK